MNADKPVTFESIAEIARQIDALNANTDPWVFEGLKVTPEQYAWLRRVCDTEPGNPFCVPLPPTLGTPVYVVATVEESTAYAEGWRGWPGVA